MTNSFKSSKVQTFKVLGLLIFSVVELLNPLNLERAFAQANFYQGKTMRIIVGNLPGDTHDLFARAYSRSMGKHIPGNPAILVQNMPGAGGMIAANHVYNVAKPDGLTLGSPSPALYYAQLVGSKEVKFDWTKFNFIGAPERNGHLLFMRVGLPVTRPSTTSAMPKSRRAAAPPASAPAATTCPSCFEEMVGLKFRLITGYPGGAEMDLAIERGEAHMPRHHHRGVFRPRAICHLAQDRLRPHHAANLAAAKSQDSRCADAVRIDGAIQDAGDQAPPDACLFGCRRLWRLADPGDSAASPRIA